MCDPEEVQVVKSMNILLITAMPTLLHTDILLYPVIACAIGTNAIKPNQINKPRKH